MATYRPKKLAELNDVYDKSLVAERAIKQSSVVMSQDEETTSASVDVVAQVQADVMPETIAPIDPNADITQIANDFILRFGTPERAVATTKLQETENIKAKVKQTSAYHPVVKTAVSDSSVQKTKPAQAQVKAENNIAVAQPTVRRVTSHTAELMNDYMKVMNDEEDDLPFFKRKKNKKNKKKNRHEETTPETSNDESAVTQETESEQQAAAEAQTEAVAEAENEAEAQEAPEVIFEATEEAEETQPESEAEETAEVQEAAEATANEEQAGEEQAGEETAEVAEGVFEEASQEDDIVDIYSSSDKTVSSASDFSDDEDGLQEENGSVENVREGIKPVKRHIFAKLVLILLVVISLASACSVGALKLWLAVDTGSAVSDSYYIFTAKDDADYANVKAGDLVIAENMPPESGDNFVYINTDTETFSFAKHTDTYVNDDGDVLYTAETENQRVGIFRDNARGVIVKTIPEIGKYISAISEYYVILICAFFAVALVLVLVLVFGFKNKPEEIEVVFDEADDDDDDDQEEDSEMKLFDEI